VASLDCPREDSGAVRRTDEQVDRERADLRLPPAIVVVPAIDRAVHRTKRFEPERARPDHHRWLGVASRIRHDDRVRIHDGEIGEQRIRAPKRKPNTRLPDRLHGFEVAEHPDEHVLIGAEAAKMGRDGVGTARPSVVESRVGAKVKREHAPVLGFDPPQGEPGCGMTLRVHPHERLEHRDLHEEAAAVEERSRPILVGGGHARTVRHADPEVDVVAALDAPGGRGRGRPDESPDDEARCDREPPEHPPGGRREPGVMAPRAGGGFVTVDPDSVSSSHGSPREDE